MSDVDTRYEHLTIYRRRRALREQAMSEGGIADVLHAATDLVHSARAATFRPGTRARHWALALREELCVMLDAADSDQPDDADSA